MYTLSFIIIREIIWYILVSVRDAIQAYANARKEMHIGFSIAIFAVEMFILFVLHGNETVHAGLSGAVLTWESLLAYIAE